MIGGNVFNYETFRSFTSKHFNQILSIIFIIILSTKPLSNYKTIIINKNRGGAYESI